MISYLCNNANDNTLYTTGKNLAKLKLVCNSDSAKVVSLKSSDLPHF